MDKTPSVTFYRVMFNTLPELLAQTFLPMKFRTYSIVVVSLLFSVMSGYSEKTKLSPADKTQVPEAKEDMGASVLDLFPDTGVEPVEGSAGAVSSITFSYVPSGSTWREGLNEEDVFYASIKGDGWVMGVGKGGSIYSLRGPYGESVPPQRIESPWNDEVWQTVATNDCLA